MEMVESMQLDVLTMKLKVGKSRKCSLHDVLYMGKLSYNLLSKATELGKMLQFVKSICKIVNTNTQKLVAILLL